MSKSCSYNALELTISVSGEWEIDRSPGMAEFRFRLTSRISDVTPSVFDIPLPESFRTLRAAETRLKVHGGTFDCSWTYIDVPFTSTAHSTLSRGLEPGTDCELDTGVDSVVLAQTVSTHADTIGPRRCVMNLALRN